MTTDPDRSDLCPDCSVAPGDLHHERCDIARCAASGQQRLGCGHSGVRCNTQWTGQYPGFAEATEYGFFARLVPGEGWQTCAADAPDAMPDLNRLYRECRWDPATQRMIRLVR
ncbi:hypothetical protein Sipo8835_37310 [Streptomyces ipomoeae]|uniref:Uncharacterized protein n=1 Tax=Streptomyces ipomoeae TaxID=103232 RepID=A0AAE9AX28_9ACTN|nr:hypothetical protein [Streptomyces ipomoeae]TQE21613.1 hypothetical protein Sipo8835_37310 [Streptomyces ipomoeae]